MKNPKVSPLIVLRIEFDDWAILFDPDTGDGYTVNPLGVFIWKEMTGEHTIEDIVKKVKENFEEVPGEVEEDCKEFIENLIERSLATC